MEKERKKLFIYHIFVETVGGEEIFKPLYDFLYELRARELRDYSIWHFSSSEDRDFFVNKLSEITKAIPVNNEASGLIEPRWRILLMGNNGHSGFSRGLTPAQYDEFILKQNKV